MKDPRIVAIDMGSAYTKVGVREGWNRESRLVRKMPLAPRDTSYCIPSIVAKVSRKGVDTWLFGEAAARQVPGGDVTTYQNWKADLFSQTSSGKARAQGRGIAVRFLGAVRDSLMKTSNGEEIAGLPARLCVPVLGDAAQLADISSSLLEEAGWQVSRRNASVYEPVSNAIGVLTRGRNSTWKPPLSDFVFTPDREMWFPKMLEPGLYRFFRGMRESYGVLVIDIGAFTTDIGHVRFDSGFLTSDWKAPQVKQHSTELGVRDLDARTKEVMGDGARNAIDAMPSAQWDGLKEKLYAGEAIEVLGVSGERLRVGEGAGSQPIAHVIAEFAERVDGVVAAFCSQFGKVDAVTLTGGGANIERLRTVLLRRKGTFGSGTELYDLLDPDEPSRALNARDGEGEVRESDLEARARQNQELVRGGSALGASSVFFE